MTDATDSPDQIRMITTPPGGIMTREVGAITGDVEIWFQHHSIRVRYVGAEDVYTIKGTPHTGDIDRVAAILRVDPGIDEDGNPRTVQLS